MSEDIVKKSLRYSIYDGAAFAIMDGMTASFITPFALALNFSVQLIAALTYVPQLIGAFVQLFTANVVEIMKDRMKILVIASLIHAILWIPLLLIPYTTPKQGYLIVLYISLQTIFVQLMVPVGNSLLGDIVPKYQRGRFFGFRNKVVGATSFIATLMAGLILTYFSPKHPFLGFTILFFIAFIARVISAIFKAMMHNPLPDLEHAEKFSLIDFMMRMNKTNYGHFVIYIVLFKFATYIAAPFFAVYMLKNLGFTYLQFTIMTTAELVASFIAMGIWGRMIDERGTKFVLYLSGMLTPIIPFFWLFSNNFYYLIVVEVFSGISWAGFNLSTSNFIFDAVKPENRIRCISYYKFFDGLSIVIGAALGGILIGYLPKWIFVSSVLVVFLISGVLRLIISLFLLPTLHEARLIELGIKHSFFKRYVTIRPSEGLIFEVIGKYRKIYNEKLLKFVDKNIKPKKEEHDIPNQQSP